MITVTLSKNLAPVVVNSFAEASQAVRQYISKRALGSSEWYLHLPFTETSKGAAIHVDGVQVAHVSYNGRVWEGVEDMRGGHQEIQI